MEYGNSNVNQTIKSKFVNCQVKCCVSSMVENILRMSNEGYDALFSWDNLENLYIDNSKEIEKLQAEIGELEGKKVEEYDENENLLKEETISEFTFERNLEKIENKYSTEISDLLDEIEEFEDEQDRPQEVFEWWIVSNRLIEKLKEKGEVVLEDRNIWGRTCSGQAILLDSVITDICEDLEILEGQKNEWKNL